MEDYNPNLENEMGTTNGIGPAPWSPFSTGPTTGYVVEPLDPNRDLRFPHSVDIFDQMRRTDAQVSAILRATTQPIMGAKWKLNGEGVDPEVLKFVEEEIGLTSTVGSRQRKRRQGIVFHHHLKDALTCLAFGFAVMEQVYIYDEDDQKLHIRKLAPRPVTTITRILVDKDGGLRGIFQTPPPPGTFGVTDFRERFIPVEKLVWYVLEKEGADWTGVSILRSAYKSWKIKTSLEVLEAQSLERNGMGIPTAQVSDEISNDPVKMAMVNKALNGFRAGATAYATFPEGVDLNILGYTGTVKDFGPTIIRHNQDISKTAMAMFMELGHDNGARSLGDTFLDQFLTNCQGVAENIGEYFTEHVIRDLVELNFGEGTAYPVLVPGDLKTNKVISPETLKTLVESGVVIPDDKLEEYERYQNGLPERDPATARTATPVSPVQTELSAPHQDLSQQLELVKRLEDLKEDREK